MFAARDSKLEELVALNLTGQIGVVLYRRLLDVFGSQREVLRASPTKLERVDGIGPKFITALQEVKKQDLAKHELDLASKLKVNFIPFDSPAYPVPLKQIPDYPILLYVRGELKPSDLLALSIVGTRNCSRYGEEQARRFAHELAGLGISIVSGLARGIDTAAHLAALDAENGRTIAVLGSGLHHIYPYENVGLFTRICERGAVISEYGLDMPPHAEHFPRRNRLLSGLSLGVLVIEAGDKSGALITAGCAAEQGREVFCVPGRIDNPRSKGCHQLIKQGAKLVENVKDILEELPACAPLLKQWEAEESAKTQPQPSAPL